LVVCASLPGVFNVYNMLAASAVAAARAALAVWILGNGGFGVTAVWGARVH
jgi:hypothetical protein